MAPYPIMSAEDETCFATRITENHNLALTLASSAIEQAVAAIKQAVIVGGLLVEAKASVRHGAWIPWIEDHLTFGDRQASKYMKAFRHREAISQIGTLGSDLSLNGFLEMIAPPKPAPTPGPKPVPEPKSTGAADQQAAAENPALLEVREHVGSQLPDDKMVTISKDDYEEMVQEIDKLHADSEALEGFLESEEGDEMTVAVEKIRTQGEQIRMLRTRMDGMMNEANELKRGIKSRDYQIKKLREESTQSAAKLVELTMTIEVLQSTPQANPDTEDADNRLAAALARAAQADSFREQLASANKRMSELLAKNRDLEAQLDEVRAAT